MYIGRLTQTNKIELVALNSKMFSAICENVKIFFCPFWCCPMVLVVWSFVFSLLLDKKFFYGRLFSKVFFIYDYLYDFTKKSQKDESLKIH